MTEPWSPERWANTLTRILNTVLVGDRFPVDVAALAKDYSRQVCPDDPVTLVQGARLPGFDGALYRAPPGSKGWGIIYNDSINSVGRVNFTLAHEFGHYLMHRQAFPDGIECSQQDVVRWDSDYRQIEHQANVFAAGLLMPLDDYRRQIAAWDKPTLAEISGCADRYQVSLIAATLRWLEYTQRRSVLVVSRDGYILWARSSSRALRSGLYFKTHDRPPIPVPRGALDNERPTGKVRESVRHPAGVWFNEPCEAISLRSEQYDFVLSLLQFSPEGAAGHVDAAEAARIRRGIGAPARE